MTMFDNKPDLACVYFEKFKLCPEMDFVVAVPRIVKSFCNC